MDSDKAHARKMLIAASMVRYNIPQDEAERRFELLTFSSILKQGNPFNDPEIEARIDGFLSVPAAQMENIVKFDIFLMGCFEDKDLVRQFDRLNGTNLIDFVDKLEGDDLPANSEDIMKQFAEFVQVIFDPELIHLK